MNAKPDQPATLVKVCGIKTPDLLEVTVQAGADMIGFVHFAKSPRHVSIDELSELISQTRGRAQSVVLLVNPDNSLIAEVSAFGPDYIQLHGTESAERVQDIRSLGGIPIIKALPIGSAEDVAKVAAYEEVADIVLLDAKPPKDSTRPGGLGEVFDWSLLKALDPNLEFMLSGGLSPNNVADAVRQTVPFAVDASSGMERAPGVKDPQMIQDFVRAVREVVSA